MYILPQAPAIMTHVTAQRHITGDVSANCNVSFQWPHLFYFWMPPTSQFLYTQHHSNLRAGKIISSSLKNKFVFLFSEDALN